MFFKRMQKNLLI